MDSREALIGLNLIDHVGPVRARQLLEHFGDAPKILQASKSELLRVRNIGEETAAAIAAWEQIPMTLGSAVASQTQKPIGG